MLVLLCWIAPTNFRKLFLFGDTARVECDEDFDSDKPNRARSMWLIYLFGLLLWLLCKLFTDGKLETLLLLALDNRKLELRWVEFEWRCEFECKYQLFEGLRIPTSDLAVEGAVLLLGSLKSAEACDSDNGLDGYSCGCFLVVYD